MKDYKPKPIEKLKADFLRRRRNKQDSFIDFESFEKWYNKQEKICHYCGLSESESQEIVINGYLISKRFPQNGKSGRGQSRGRWLEVDRLIPTENYSPDNCVLACYFCNNDKSDIFSGNDYKKFMFNRVEFLRELIKQKNGL